ncbi:MAG: cyclopropane-fatty-acyl-phospholipid synthase family protein, partial [Acidobacteriota bacterium]
MTTSIADIDGLERGLLTGSPLGRRWARRMLLDKLQDLDRGRLRLIDSRGSSVIGSARGAEECEATIHVHDPRFWPKVLFGGSIGASEAYMAGLWSASDLREALRFFLINREAMDRLEAGAGTLFAPFNRLRQALRTNSKRGSRSNIKAHYDLSNDFFEIFLDRHMMYSSAVFTDAEGRDLGEDLEAATEAKLDRICRKAELGPEDHVLEIGTGWGGFAVWAASRYGCRVTTTTISPEQYGAAVARVRRHGLEERVTVLQKDYRDLEGSFDKLISIEMIEAVGHDRLDDYFRVCAERLKPGGRMVLQGITIADRLYARYRESVDFIQRYVFPGSALPSVSAISASLARSGDLQIVHLEDIGPHYARTLAAWRQRFFDRLD